jgi:hypothetical protein
MGSVHIPVKLNAKDQGTCSVGDKEDPNTLLKDGIKDLQCQFPTSGMAPGKYLAVVTGTFKDQVTSTLKRAFLATQEVTILP